MIVTGRHVLIAMLAFFAVTFAVNGALIVSAFRTFSGLDEPKSYAQGVHFDDVLKRRAEQRALAWRAEVTASRNGDTARIILDLRDSAGRAVNFLVLKAKLEHPSSSKRDIPLTFAEVQSGRYEADATGITKGEWALVIVADENATEPFEMKRNLWLP